MLIDAPYGTCASGSFTNTVPLPIDILQSLIPANLGRPRLPRLTCSILDTSSVAQFRICGNHRILLHVVQVVGPADGSEGELPFTTPGVAVNSTSSSLDLTGMLTSDASSAVISWLGESGCGAAHTNYKLRDWLFATQRYWGEPFPVVYPEGSDEIVAGMSRLLCAMHSRSVQVLPQQPSATSL